VRPNFFILRSYTHYPERWAGKHGLSHGNHYLGFEDSSVIGKKRGIIFSVLLGVRPNALQFPKSGKPNLTQ